MQKNWRARRRRFLKPGRFIASTNVKVLGGVAPSLTQYVYFARMNERGSALKQFLQRLYLSFNPANRVVILDYPVEPKPLYSATRPHRRLEQLVALNDNHYASLLEASKVFFYTASIDPAGKG